MIKSYVYLALFALPTLAACTAETGSAPATDKTSTQASADTVTTYNIINAHSGMCLNVYNWSEQNGANVDQAADCSINPSKWEKVVLEQYADGTELVNFRALHSGQCLNVYNWGHQNGDNVVQALDCDVWPSKWYVKPLGGGLNNIIAGHDRMCLNVLNRGTRNGDNVVQAADCTIDSSMWYLNP